METTVTAPVPFDGTTDMPKRQRGTTAIRTLIVGTGRRAAVLAASLLADPARELVGTLDVTQLPDLWRTAPNALYLGSPRDIERVAVAQAVDEICVALPLKSCFDEWLHVGRVGQDLGIPVSFQFDFFGQTAWTELQSLPDAAMLRCHVHPSSRGFGVRGKRLFDILIASLVLIGVSPIFLSAALLVKLTSRGPIFFRQPRVGRSRRSFGMIKFRTMVANAEELRASMQAMNDAKGIMFKIARDPRLTVVGPLLRRTSIDELPQLLNVIVGDMSLVGPRPIPLWVYEQIEEPSFHRRFSVLPGMTGMWQVKGRQQHYTAMARHDLEYVDRWSFWLDLKILALTIPAVLRRHEAQ